MLIPTQVVEMSIDVITTSQMYDMTPGFKPLTENKPCIGARFFFCLY